MSLQDPEIRSSGRWSSEEDLVLREIWSRTSDLTLIQKALSQRTFSAIRNRVHTLKLGPKVDAKKRPWTPEEISVLEAIFTTASKSELETQLPGRSADACLIQGYKLGLGIRPVALSPQGSLAPLLEYTPEASYWMGFLMADGCLTQNRLKVALAAIDTEHLQTFASFLGPNVNITLSVRQSPTVTRHIASLSLQDSANSPLLKSRFDWHDRKTYNPPTWLPYEDITLLRAWLVGFIDGDGTIGLQSGRKSATLRTVSHLSWIEFLTDLAETLEFGKVSQRRGGETSSKWYAQLATYRHHEICDLKRFAQTHHLPILSRKWDKVDLDLPVRKSPSLSS